MFKEYSRYRVLKVFLDHPLKEFGLREIGRKSNLSPPSVKNYLKEFLSKELIIQTERGYKAERENEDYIFYKKLSIINELHHSGLIEYLWQKLAPEAIILYGSHVKGESTEDSDVDLYIFGKRKEIPLEKFEKKISKEIHLMFSSDIKSIPKELKNNLVNGITLKGYWKTFK